MDEKALVERRGDLKARITAIGGDEYRGCWIDSARNRKGKEYKRLRWFLVDGKKGCRVLKDQELGRVSDALALLGELDSVDAELGKIRGAIAEIEVKIAALSG